MVNTGPLFSIVIPTRNRAHLLPKALRSALEQTFDDYEIIVLANDCQDNTREVVDSMRTQRVSYYETEAALTMPENWERAWSLARGRYVTYLPDDDAIVPSALAMIADHALEGEPGIVSWEDAPYYYPDWHDEAIQNILLLFHHGDQLLEDVPSRFFREQCATFAFAWSSPLPKLLNCMAQRELFESWRRRLGTLFFPVAPDYSFAWIATHVCDSIRIVHRPLSVRGISDHSIGSNAGLGAAAGAFFSEFGQFDFFADAPLRVPTSLNHLAATFQRAGRALASLGVTPERIDRERLVLGVARQLRESAHLLPNWAEHTAQLLTAAAELGGDARLRVEHILADSPDGEATPRESIRALRNRTMRMALADASTLGRLTEQRFGDEECARCALGLEKGVLAASDWSYLYVFGDEVGASDPYGMSKQVDPYYDRLLTCRVKQGQAVAASSNTLYDQETDIDLLTRLLLELDNKIVIDVGAEKGAFVQAFLQHGATAVFAIEPHPASAGLLRAKFADTSRVRVLELALGDRDAVVPLYIAEDKTGRASEAYHSLVAFEETATVRRAGEIAVECRTLDALVEQGVLPDSVGVLKVDAERNDLAIVQAMGRLFSAVVMLEFWDDLPETVGQCPYRVSELASVMSRRGYSNFVVIKRRGGFELLQLNDARTEPGEWGNVVFVHDTHFPRLAATLFGAMADAQKRLLGQAEMFATECQKRLEVIEEQERRIAYLEAAEHEQAVGVATQGRPEQAAPNGDQELAPALNAPSASAGTLSAGRSGGTFTDHAPAELGQEVAAILREQAEALARLERRVAQISEQYERSVQQLQSDYQSRAQSLERELASAQGMAEARLRVIDIQERTLARYRWLRPRLALERWTAPRIGQLYQYPPRDLLVPPRYHQLPRLDDPPRISIVTPSFNQGEFIERTLRSVIEQRYPTLEYIVKDGESADSTLSLLEKYRNSLTYYESSPDTGFGNGINQGFARSTGEIMAYLNSDDILLPGALHYVAKYFVDHPEVDVVYGHRVVIDEYDREIGRWVLPPHDDEVLSWADYIPQETLFWRRRIWERSGAAIDESFRFAIDWDLLIRFREAGAKMVRLPRFLGGFRVHPHQKTSKEMADLGLTEMDRLRERCHGRRVLTSEISRALRPYLRRHFVLHKLYRLGLLRY